MAENILLKSLIEEGPISCLFINKKINNIIIVQNTGISHLTLRLLYITHLKWCHLKKILFNLSCTCSLSSAVPQYCISFPADTAKEEFSPLPNPRNKVFTLQTLRITTLWNVVPTSVGIEVENFCCNVFYNWGNKFFQIASSRLAIWRHWMLFLRILVVSVKDLWSGNCRVYLKSNSYCNSIERVFHQHFPQFICRVGT